MQLESQSASCKVWNLAPPQLLKHVQWLFQNYCTPLRVLERLTSAGPLAGIRTASGSPSSRANFKRFYKLTRSSSSTWLPPPSARAKPQGCLTVPESTTSGQHHKNRVADAPSFWPGTSTDPLYPLADQLVAQGEIEGSAAGVDGFCFPCLRLLTPSTAPKEGDPRF